MANTTTVVDPSQSGVSTNILGSLFDYHAMMVFALKFLVAFILVGILLWISRIISKTIQKRIIMNSVVDNDEYAQKLGGVISDIIFYVFAIFSLLIGFEVIGFDVGFIIGGLSFGIGFAFKDILSNLIAGIFLLTTKEFKLGDMIEVIVDPRRDVVFFGRVEEITIRYTVIRTLDMRRVIVPNLSMVVNPVKTFNSESIVRLETALSIPYDADLDKTVDVIRNAINALDYVQENDNTTVLVNGFSEKGADLRIMFFVDPNCGFAKPRIIGEINKVIFRALKEYSMPVSYPHTTITVDKTDKNLLQTIMFAKKKD